MLTILLEPRLSPSGLSKDLTWLSLPTSRTILIHHARMIIIIAASLEEGMGASAAQPHAIPFVHLRSLHDGLQH